MSTTPPKLKPRATWYFLPAVVLLVGIGVGIALLISGFAAYADSIDSLARIPAGGTGKITFDHAGSYSIYFEQPGVDSSTRPSVRVSMTKSGSGTPVALEVPRTTSNYTRN